MIKYFIIPLLLLGSVHAYPRCSPDLENALKTVHRFPQGKKLIREVEAQGTIQVYRARFNSRSNAMWVVEERAIVINANQNSSFGEIVRSIFFELHNAKVDQEFNRLDHLAQIGHLSKQQYVEAVEWLEYKNAYQASKLIDHAIKKGYFPQSSRWPIAPDFQTHFLVQKQAGHSQQIALLYDLLT